MASRDKTPPLLSETENYTNWKKAVAIWSNFTSLPDTKQGAALFLTLQGSARDAALELSQDAISSATGLNQVLRRLDDLYLKDETLQKYEAFEAFDSFRRPSHMSIPEFLHAFNLLSNKLQSYGTTISDDLLAFKLLKAANLSPDHEKLAKATCDLKYSSMKDQLRKIFADTQSSNVSAPSAPLRPDHINLAGSSSATDTLYTRQSGSYRKSVPSRPNNSSSGQRSIQFPSSRPITFAKKGRNPPDPAGNTTRCVICDSVNHWANDCPDKRPSRRSRPTYMASHTSVPASDSMTDDIVMFQSDFDHPSNLRTLVAESWNHAVLDSGASKTVCGAIWLANYVDSLSDTDKATVTYSNSTNSFCFGDGQQVQSQSMVRLPAYLGDKRVYLMSDIVDLDIPLLFSRVSMKNAKMNIDFETDTVHALGQHLPLSITQSGHYILPLTVSTQVLQSFNQQNPVPQARITLQVHSVCKDPAALIKLTEKLHRQFAHAPAHKLISLIKGAGSPWSDDPALTAQIKKTVAMCPTCNLYKKPPSRPTVGLPLATRFQETVAMDLKFYQGKIILHLIDHATRLSQAVHIPSKNPRVIIEALLTNWISIYGPADKFLSDNGGEFVNNEFLALCEQFNIAVHTTAAESPWSNGLVERHNLILADMLNKVIADTGCSFNIALQWCTTAKNSLQNVHGFSPYQLALGQNPKLPALLTNSLPAQETQPSSSEIVRHHLNALHKAREAFIQSENSAKLKRALTHNTRTSNDSIFINGDRVYYIRQGDTRWRGPAVVLGQDGQQFLLKHGGFYIRVHRCRLQHVPPVVQAPAESTKIDQVPLHSKTQPVNSSTALASSSDSEDEDQHEPDVMPFSTPRNATHLPHPPTTPRKSDTPRRSMRLHHLSSSVPIYDQSSPNPHSDTFANSSLSSSDPSPPSPSKSPTSEQSVSSPISSAASVARNQSVSSKPCSSAPVPPASSKIKLTALSGTPDYQQLKKGVLTSVQLISDIGDTSQHLFRLLSRSGKATGRYAYSWNVQDAQGNIRSIDFKHDVASWSVVSTSSDHSMQDEFQVNNILITEPTSEIYSAKIKELQNWSDNNVYNEVTDKGQPFMTVRWVITNKGDPSNPTVKAWLVAHGFQETQEFRKDSPTCTKECVRLALSLIASMGWSLKSLDIKSAFLQGETIDRTIYIKPPPEAGSDKLWRLNKCIYGLADAPRCFYLRLREVLETFNVQASTLDEGLFFALDNDNQLMGILACHVDDLLYGGSMQFYDLVINSLRDKLVFGSENASTFTYIGMHVVQHPDKSISLDQSSFMDSITPIAIPPDRLADKSSPLTKEEITQLRAAIGQLNWLATVSQPQISFEICQASSRVKTSTIADMITINKVISKVQQQHSYLHFSKLDLSSTHIRVYTDASFNNLPEGGSQEGNIVFLADAHNACCPISWASNRAKRVVRSTLAAETLSLNDGTDSAFYLSKLLCSVLPAEDQNPKIVAITDNKSAVAAICSTSSVSDRRLRVEISALREYQEESRVSFQHVKGTQQLADVFTKRGASDTLLLQVLQSGKLP